MATTMKKSEIQATAKANIIAEIIPNTARQIGAATYAMPTEVDGITCWVKIALTCGNPIGTEKVPAFDIEQACADWEEEKADNCETFIHIPFVIIWEYEFDIIIF